MITDEQLEEYYADYEDYRIPASHPERLDGWVYWVGMIAMVVLALSGCARSQAIHGGFYGLVTKETKK